MQRVAVYIDGLNLYYGIRSSGWGHHQWVNPWDLSMSLLKPGQRLESVHYFSSKFLPEGGNKNEAIQQNKYLEALEAIDDLQVHYGYHQVVRRVCPTCGASRSAYEEKETDVNIAVRMVLDGADDAFAVAILISGDGDLAGPVRAIRARHPEKHVVAAFLPKQKSENIRNAATTTFVIGRKRISDSQLPDEIAKPDGYILRRPERWR